jgi:predicted ABC-type ATPase
MPPRLPSGRRGDTYERYFERDGPDHERLALHEAILTRFLASGTPRSIHERPKAILVLGLPGSGKSRFARQWHDTGLVLVDSDPIKELLPEYQEAREAGRQDAAELVHREASRLSGEVWIRAVAQRCDFLYLGTGRDLPMLYRCVGELRELGYRVELLLLHVSLTTATRRVAARVAAGGRWVDETVIAACDRVLSNNFQLLARMVDRAVIFDHEGSQPLPVWELEDGDEHVVDASRRAAFLATCRANRDHGYRHRLAAAVISEGALLVVCPDPPHTRWNAIASEAFEPIGDLGRRTQAWIEQRSSIEIVDVVAFDAFGLDDDGQLWCVHPFCLRPAANPRPQLAGHHWLPLDRASDFLAREPSTLLLRALIEAIERQYPALGPDDR